MTKLRIHHLLLLSGVPSLPGLSAALGLSDGVDPEGPLVMASQAEARIIAASHLYASGLPWVKARDVAGAAFLLAEQEASYEELIRPTPGLTELFSALSRGGIKIGIATTDTSGNALSQLRYLGLASFVEAVVGSDNVQNGKPHPEMLELACSQLGIPVSQAVMVGDGPNDLKMGRAAGALATVGVLSGVGTPELLSPFADLLVPCAGDLRDYLAL